MDEYKIIDESQFSQKDVSNVNLENIKYISGVYKFDIVTSDTFHSSFLLFGDLHRVTNKGFINDNDKMLYLPYYLDALFKRYPETQFDLMLEFPLLSSTANENYLNNSAIITTSYQFRECFYYYDLDNKLDCKNKFPNVRFHNVDIRKHDYNEDEKYDQYHFRVRDFYNYIDYLGKIHETALYGYVVKHDLSCEEDQRKIKKRIQKLSNMMDEFKDTPKYYDEDQDNHINYKYQVYTIFRNFYDHKFEKYKNLDKIKLVKTFIKNKLFALFQMNHDQLFILLEQLVKKSEHSNITNQELGNIAFKVVMFIVNLKAILMDFYTLIRFLKIQSYGSKNIVYIAGADHTDTFKDFILSIDPNMKRIIGNDYLEPFIYKNYNYTLIWAKTFNLQLLDSYNTELEYMLYSVRKILDHLKKNNIRVQKDRLENLRNLRKIIKNRIHLKSEFTDKLFENPGLRITPVNFGKLEKALILEELPQVPI